MKHIIFITVMAFVSLVLGCGLVAAADPMAGAPVIDRNFKRLEPKGIRLGQFLVFPNITTAAEYTTNVLQTNAKKDSDRIAIISPDIKAEAEFGSHVVSFDLEGDQFLYDKYDSQDRLNYSTQAAINLSLSSIARLDAKIVAQQDHNRGVEEADFTLDASEPIQYNRVGFLTDLLLKPSRYEWRIGTAISRITHKNTRTLENRTLLVQDDRDRTSYGGSINVTYDAGLRFEPAMGIKYTRYDFDKRNYINASMDYTGVDQDRQRIAILGGIEMLPTGKWRGMVKGGVGYEISKDDLLDNQLTNLVDIDLTYLYTPLTNFSFEFDRFFDDDTNATRGSIQTRIEASVVHELTRQWVLSGGVEYEWRDFQNGNEDTTLTGTIGANYALNRRYTLGGMIEYIDRESNRLNGDFDETTALIRLKSAF